MSGEDNHKSSLDMTRRRFMKACLLACGLMAPSLMSSCSWANISSSMSKAPAHAETYALGTYVSITGYCSQDIVDEALSLCVHYDELFSRTIEGSDTWNINHARGERVYCDSETIELVKRSIEYAQHTQGLFDITIGTLTTQWDFIEGVKPSDEAIAASLEHVGYSKVHVGDGFVELDDPDTCLDFGGIAKGYIADKIAAFLRENGCMSALMNLGGHICVVGSKPDGALWHIGASNPDVNDGEVYATFEVSDASVVSSGLYERSFELDGVTYHHILDPRTGYPVQTDVLNATIVSGSSIDADVYATVAFLQGFETACETFEELSLDALLLNTQKEWKQIGNPHIIE